MNYLVLGAGISGLSAAKYLAAKGHSVVLSNEKDIPAEQANHLKLSKIKLHIGKQDESLLSNIDCLVVSPGISEIHPTISGAMNKKTPILSEIDIAVSDFKGKLIGITGTNGKSTTTAMVAHILNHIGKKAVACGNIGLPPSQLLLEKNPASYWAMELSSYQIQSSKPIPCDAVIFTSFSPDHMARHGSLEKYFAAKWKLCSAMRPEGILILSSSAHQQAKILDVSIPKHFLVIKDANGFDFSCTKLITNHDRLNALFASSAVSHLVENYTLQQLINLLSDFKGLPFRYELVAKVNDHLIINDSKATNVESTMMALANQKAPCLLLLGGEPKGESYAPLLHYKDCIDEAWLFGAAADLIYQDLSAKVVCKKFSTLKSLLPHLKYKIAALDRNIIFSPACASFDEFKNFEDRGQYFNREIQTYVQNAN